MAKISALQAVRIGGGKIMSIFINGVNMSAPAAKGGSISIVNGKVFINGVDVTPDSKEVVIKVDGDIESLQVDHAKSIEIKGDIGTVKTVSGDLRINGDVKGHINTVSGDVTCNVAAGGISTVSGDINH